MNAGAAKACPVAVFNPRCFKRAERSGGMRRSNGVHAATVAVRRVVMTLRRMKYLLEDATIRGRRRNDQ